MFEDVVVALSYQQVARVAEPDHLLDLRIGSDERGAEKFGGGDCIVLGVIQVDILVDPIDAVGVDIVAVVTELVSDVQNDQQADTEAGSEADDVEGGESLAFPEAAEGNLEIVAEHGLLGFVLSKAAKSSGRSQNQDDPKKKTIPKECRVYKVLKTIFLSGPARDIDVRFRYGNRAGTSIGGGMRGHL